MFLANRLDYIVRDFAVFEDPQERLAAVVDGARKTPPLPSHQRIDANRVTGCVSVVWLVCELHAGRCYFQGDADSPLVRGLVVFLCDFFNGAPMAEVATSGLDPLEALELTRNLSPTRRSGLAAARKAIQTFAQQSAKVGTQ